LSNSQYYDKGQIEVGAYTPFQALAISNKIRHLREIGPFFENIAHFLGSMARGGGFSPCPGPCQRLKFAPITTKHLPGRRPAARFNAALLRPRIRSRLAAAAEEKVTAGYGPAEEKVTANAGSTDRLQKIYKEKNRNGP